MQREAEAGEEKIEEGRREAGGEEAGGGNIRPRSGESFWSILGNLRRTRSSDGAHRPEVRTQGRTKHRRSAPTDLGGAQGEGRGVWGRVM